MHVGEDDAPCRRTECSRPCVCPGAGPAEDSPASGPPLPRWAGRAARRDFIFSQAPAEASGPGSWEAPCPELGG